MTMVRVQHILREKCKISRRIIEKNARFRGKFAEQTRPPKVPLPVAASAFPCHTCSLDPPDSAFQTASRDCWTVRKHIANGTSRSFMN